MTLVFLHGAGFTGESFAAQSAAFPDSHAPNLPGHLAPGEASSIADFAEFAAAYIAGHELHDVVLCGHSMGAAAALEVALAGQVPLRGLVLVGAGARLRVAPAILNGMRADFGAAVEQVTTYFFAHPAPERLAWARASMNAVGQGQTVRDFEACNAFDALERLSSVSVPLIAVTGEHDKMTPAKYAQAFAHRVPGAQARIVPGAGHFVMVEQPEETNGIIGTFLSRIP